MKNPSTILILVAIIIALAFGLWGTCAAKKADAAKTAAVAQAQAAEASASRWKARGDSADSRADSAIIGWGMERVQWTRDSARMVSDFVRADTAVNQVKIKLGGQVAEYHAAKALADTAGQLRACDSITTELAKAKVAVTDLQTSAETIQAAFSNEIQQRDSTINILAGSVLALRTAKDSLAAIALDQARRNIKLASAPAKHWGVGIGAGYVIGPKGAGPGVSVTVHYDIFHF